MICEIRMLSVHKSFTLEKGARDGQNLISWRWSLPLSTKPTFVRIDARNFELSW